jgi:hypothetical protein
MVFARNSSGRRVLTLAAATLCRGGEEQSYTCCVRYVVAALVVSLTLCAGMAFLAERKLAVTAGGPFAQVRRAGHARRGD